MLLGGASLAVKLGKHLSSAASFGLFQQSPPQLGNTYSEDSFLSKWLKFNLPDKILSGGNVETELFSLGEKCAHEFHTSSLACEANPPYLRSYDAWGKRIDEIVTCHDWKSMKGISAAHGMISTAYEREYAQWSRVVQGVKLYLFVPSSGLYGCPLAMTDGAASVIEELKLQQTEPFKKAYERLTTRNPEQFWTSGQWMTERAGGSDVASGCRALAYPHSGWLKGEPGFELWGNKWFSSAADSDLAFTLARTVDQKGNATDGSQGISMFFLPVRLEDGSLNNIQIRNLKNKLGTRQLPTAELDLQGTLAYQVGEPGQGIKCITPMLNITRIHNSISAVASMRRILQLARNYGKRRLAFGRPISKHSLHVHTLADMEITCRGCFLFLMEALKLQGLMENRLSTPEDELLLRVFTPLLKLFTAKQALSVVSEGLECFGGQGYIEDTGLPGMLRDAQVLPIWEGTTNVLSLDFLRVLVKDPTSISKALHFYIKRVTEEAPSNLGEVSEDLIKSFGQCLHLAVELGKESDQSQLPAASRDLSLNVCHILCGALLLRHAKMSRSEVDVMVAKRWMCLFDCGQFQRSFKSDFYTKTQRGYESDLIFATE